MAPCECSGGSAVSGDAERAEADADADAAAAAGRHAETELAP